jgi:hypothetical protein
MLEAEKRGKIAVAAAANFMVAQRFCFKIFEESERFGWSGKLMSNDLLRHQKNLFHLALPARRKSFPIPGLLRFWC